MNRRVAVAFLFALGLTTARAANVSQGEHLAYTVGCVNCHHQTHKSIINAPPLLVVKGYSLPEFRKLMRTGVTRAGRDMAAQGSIMGIVAKEQFSHLTDGEIAAVYAFLTREWTQERAMEEEKKIPILFRPLIEKGGLPPVTAPK